MNQSLVDITNTVFGISTIVLMVSAAALLILVGSVYIARNGQNSFARKLDQGRIFIYQHGLLFIFVLSLSGVVGSLWYSNVIGFAPCVLCWYQRIFLYPIAIVTAISFWRRDTSGYTYSLVLSGIGLVIALLHILEERAPSVSTLCSSDALVPCSKLWVDQFGFITIPTMSATLFLLIISISVVALHQQKLTSITKSDE